MRTRACRAIEGVLVGSRLCHWARRRVSGAEMSVSEHENVHCMIRRADVSSPLQAKKILLEIL